MHHLDSASRADDLAGQLRARVESAREVRVVDTIPLTSVLKTDRKALRRLLTSGAPH